jgi:tetratricopeptide (TPR) repeat protein
MAVMSQTILQQALSLHRKGDAAAAEPLYRAILAGQPDHDEAAHNLGLLLAQRGAHAEALTQFQTALKSQPRVGQYWLSYADALLATGHPREAHVVLSRGQQRGLKGPAVDALLRKAEAASAPTDADRGLELATGYAAQGRMSEAIAAYRELLAIAPGHAEAHFRLGSILSETGDIAEGFAHYMRRAQLVHDAPARDTGKPDPAHRTKHDREQAEYLTRELGLPASSALPFHLEDGERLSVPAINPANATAALVERWKSAWPPMVVIDDFLTPGALRKLQLYCAGSTIWRRNYEAGYIGATPEDGLACPLMVQIAEEISATFPQMIGGHGFRYLGAFKYDSELSTGTNTHVDNSAVNVNFYIAPDEANLDPESGGMDIWNIALPQGEDMRKYNGDEAAARDFLARSNAVLTRIPHRCNRAVIFKSDLFHKTSDCRFREGYLLKRINVSLLFGQHGEATQDRAG